MGPGLFEFPSDRQRLVRTASVTQVRQPIYRNSLSRWRRYQEMLAPLLVRLKLSETG